MVSGIIEKTCTHAEYIYIYIYIYIHIYIVLININKQKRSTKTQERFANPKHHHTCIMNKNKIVLTLVRLHYSIASTCMSRQMHACIDKHRVQTSPVSDLENAFLVRIVWIKVHIHTYLHHTCKGTHIHTKSYLARVRLHYSVVSVCFPQDFIISARMCTC